MNEEDDDYYDEGLGVSGSSGVFPNPGGLLQRKPAHGLNKLS